MFRRKPASVMPLLAGVSVAAGATAVAFSVLRIVRNRRNTYRFDHELDALENAAVEVLRKDAVTGACAIDVAAVGPGIIELSGTVPNREAGQRAARLLHAVAGVRTVINRTSQGVVEDRLAENRAKRDRGEPYTLDRHWYGVRVGTGRRRQSLQTEPERPDDTVKRRTRELEVSPSEIADATTPSDRAGEEPGDTSR